VFGNAWRVGRLGGIELRVDSSWLVIAALIAFSFFARFDVLYGELSTAQAILLAVAAAGAFFASVVVHELAHAVVAVRRGIQVDSITLFLFGGATAARVDSKGPKEEFLISIVGPVTSAALAAGLGALASGLGPMDEPAAGIVGYLAWLNLVLAVFNLLPGLPLDGGRVFRSAVWAVTGDLRRATRVAAAAGQVVGYGLVGLGVASLFGGAGGGLWLAFIGWFLSQSARASYAELELRRALEGVEAVDVMTAELVCVPAGLSVAEAVDGYFLRRDHSSYPVVDGGEVVGFLSLDAVRAVAPADRDATPVRQVMRPLDDVPAVGPHDRVIGAFERLGDDGGPVLVRDESLVGIITARDLSRWFQRRRAVGAGRP